MLKRTEPLKLFQFQPLHQPTATICDDTVILDATITKQGLPLFLLVPGQHDNKAEVTALWGGNPYKESDSNTPQTDTAVPEKLPASKAFPDTPPDTLPHPSPKQLRKRLLADPMMIRILYPQHHHQHL